MRPTKDRMHVDHRDQPIFEESENGVGLLEQLTNVITVQGVMELKDDADCIAHTSK